MTVKLREIYDRLLARYGPQHWWPGDTPFEVLVGAVLVQNTNWRNVERAIANLREAGVLEPRTLYLSADEELADMIRPAGYFRVKAKRLKNLLRLVVERYGGSLDAMFATPQDELREQLLSINGIGPETADCILLYAAGKPTFVVDAYALRVMARHGWIEFNADYHAVKDHFESRLEPDVQVYNEFHALLVKIGKEHCRKTPLCEGCPLQDLLPDDGPLKAEWEDG